MEVVYRRAPFTAEQGKVEESTPRRIEIGQLLGRRLEMPLVAAVEPLLPGFKAHAAGTSVFGYGSDVVEAVEVLRDGIEHIFEEEEFLDLRAAIQSMLPPEKLMTGEESEMEHPSGG